MTAPPPSPALLDRARKAWSGCDGVKYHNGCAWPAIDAPNDEFSPCDLHMAIARALEEEYGRGLERAAKLADERQDIYSEDIFRPVTEEETKSLGVLCDRISAHMGRHVARLLAIDIRRLVQEDDE